MHTYTMGTHILNKTPKYKQFILGMQVKKKIPIAANITAFGATELPMESVWEAGVPAPSIEYLGIYVCICVYVICMCMHVYESRAPGLSIEYLFMHKRISVCEYLGMHIYICTYMYACIYLWKTPF